MARSTSSRRPPSTKESNRSALRRARNRGVIAAVLSCRCRSHPRDWPQGESSQRRHGGREDPFDDVAGYQPWHHARFAVKPGMTGLWQVSSRLDPDFDRWVELDLEYIRDWSLELDIQIMARTIPAILHSEGR